MPRPGGRYPRVRRRGTDIDIHGPYEWFPKRDDGPCRPSKDTDRDGMPDEWEEMRKLNPRDPSDGPAQRLGWPANTLATPIWSGF